MDGEESCLTWNEVSSGSHTDLEQMSLSDGTINRMISFNASTVRPTSTITDNARRSLVDLRHDRN